MPIPDFSGCTVSVSTCVDCPPPLSSSSTTLPLYLRNSMLASAKLPFYGDGSCLRGCDTGYYSANIFNDSRLVCSPCPAGTFRAYAPGFSLNSTIDSCIACDRGKYAPTPAWQATSCLSCGKWTVPASNDYCLDCSDPACATCKNNNWTKITRKNCTCMAGTYMSSTPAADGSFACLECPADYISVQGADSCFRCPPGRFCVDLEPRICPAGYFRPTPQSMCSPCLKGFISTSAESSACVPCAPGSYSDVVDGTTCTLCPNNTFLPVAGGNALAQCRPCRAWVQESITLAPGASKCGCPAGKYHDGYTCRACITSCHPDAVMANPCLWGSTSDTVTCTCKPGYAGDGILTCTLCLNPNECVCAKASHYAFVDI